MSQYQTCMIPIDNILNHLETAFNTEKMKAVFQQYLYPSLSVRIETCNIERIKYKPQKNCHVSYRLSFKKNHLNKANEQLVCVRFYEHAGSMSRFLKESDKKNSQNLLIHIPELDCVTWVFPNDRKLINLERVTDPEFLCQQVAPYLILSVYGSDWSIDKFKSDMIRYVPEQNCSMRIQLEIAHSQSKQQKKMVAYGKYFYNQSGQQIYHTLCQLWDSEICREGVLNIPEPLLYHSKYSMLWQMGVPGVMLSELYINQTLFLNSVANAARQIALLHQVPLYDCPRNNQENIIQELRKVGQLLNKFNVPCRQEITNLIEKLVVYFSTVMPEHQVVLHGDLHLKNILVDSDRVYLIDLDNVSLGNPFLDIGSFIAAILNLELTDSIPLSLADQTIGFFLSAYCEAVPWTVNKIDLRKYIAMALVTERIFRSFTRLKAGRMEIIDDLVKQAEMMLNGSFTPQWL